jgi:hypothetical protein
MRLHSAPLDSPYPLKVRLARAQLGSALDLYIRDKDPFPVHSLACGGCELIEGFAQTAGISTLSTHVLEAHPDIDIAKIRKLRNQYWNAMKHFYARDLKSERDDHDLMESFSDSQNDTPLFMGWFDYVQVTGKLPIAVQVFQVWWYSVYEDKLAPGVERDAIRSVFPNMFGQERAEQKRRLRRAIERYRSRRDITEDPRTEHLPLTLVAG